MVDVVGAEPGAHHPHEGVVLLVAALGGGEGGEGLGAVRRLEPRELLGDQAHRLLPGPFAEGAVPGIGGRDAIADVILAESDREPRLRGFSRGAHRGLRLPLLATLFNGVPRPFAVPRRLPGPDPLGAVVLPPLPDQRMGEAVAVLGEVVAEAPLHAGGALVRGLLLDPRRGDTDHLAPLRRHVELASDPAVGTDGAGDLLGGTDRLLAEALAGDELEDGTGGADADALAAPGAAGVIGVAVSADDDLGVAAAVPDVEDADLLDILARPDAAGAEDAVRHIVLDHRVAGALVPVAERELAH